MAQQPEKLEPIDKEKKRFSYIPACSFVDVNPVYIYPVIFIHL